MRTDLFDEPLERAMGASITVHRDPSGRCVWTARRGSRATRFTEPRVPALPVRPASPRNPFALARYLAARREWEGEVRRLREEWDLKRALGLQQMKARLDADREQTRAVSPLPSKQAKG